MIGLGGFTGSILRYAVYVMFDKPVLAKFPYATLIVNIIGSFLIGVLYVFAQKHAWFSENVRFFLAVGFCGSFTTFSTFALENLTLIKSSHSGLALLYILFSVVLSVIAVFAGYWVAK